MFYIVYNNNGNVENTIFFIYIKRIVLKRFICNFWF